VLEQLRYDRSLVRRVGVREAERPAHIIAPGTPLRWIEVSKGQAVEVEALVEEPSVRAGLESDVWIACDRPDLVRWNGPVDEVERAGLEGVHGRLDVPVETVDDLIDRRHSKVERSGILRADRGVRDEVARILVEADVVPRDPSDELVRTGTNDVPVLRLPRARAVRYVVRASD